MKHRRGDAAVERAIPGESRGAESGERRRVDVSEWMLEVASDPTAREILIAGGTQISPRSDVPKDSSDSRGRARGDGRRRRSRVRGWRVVGAPMFVGGDGISRAARAIGGDDDAGSVAFRRASHRRDVHGHPSRVHLPRLAANARRISEPRRRYLLHARVFRAGVGVGGRQARRGSRRAGPRDSVRVPRRGIVRPRRARGRYSRASNARGDGVRRRALPHDGSSRGRRRVFRLFGSAGALRRRRRVRCAPR